MTFPGRGSLSYQHFTSIHSFLLFCVLVPLCLPFFKYNIINNTFTSVVLMSWISYLTFISVSQVFLMRINHFLSAFSNLYYINRIYHMLFGINI